MKPRVRLDPVLRTARKILAAQHRVVLARRQAAAAGVDPTALHDLRVSMRRFRTALRFFRGRLQTTAAGALEREIVLFSNRLGRFRDTEVWLEFLAPAPGDDRRIAAHKAALLRRQRAPRRARLAALLESGETRRLLDRMDRLSKIEIPSVPARRNARYAPHAARRVRRLYRRVLDQGPVRPSDSPQAVHRFRKLVRRSRYCAEMAEPGPRGAAPALARRLRALADALGDIHDCEVFLAKLSKSTDPAALAMVRHLRRTQKSCWARCRKAWRRVAARKFTERALDALNRMEKGQ